MNLLRGVGGWATLLAAAVLALLSVAWSSSHSGEDAPRSLTLSVREDLELQTILDVNAARAGRGLPSLAAESSLGEIARERSTDMAALGYFSHYAPDGSAIYISLLDQKQIPWLFAGENLARREFAGDNVAQVTVENWTNSPPHAAHLFSASYNRAGIGVVEAGTETYFTLIFVGE